MPSAQIIFIIREYYVVPKIGRLFSLCASGQSPIKKRKLEEQIRKKFEICYGQEEAAAAATILINGWAK